MEEGIVHYCVANMPGAYARTATQALTNATYRYIELVADYGVEAACAKEPSLYSGINISNGEIVHPAILEAYGMMGIV